MHIAPLHPWEVSYGEAVAIQKSLRDSLVMGDPGLQGQIHLVAGADISYERRSDLFFAAVVVLDYESMALREEAFAVGRASFPYIPGLLSFREGPLLLEAFAKLEEAPDAVLFDGQGIAHPRRFGLASHLGLFLDLPSVGCAKTRLCGTHDACGPEVGDTTPLKDGAETIGAVLQTKSRVRPVFVSPGHRIGLQQSLELVIACCRGYRLPEPVRQAHLAVNRLRCAHHSPA